MTVEIGKFNKLCTIQRRTITQDEIGGEIESYSNHVTNVWAQILPVSAREFVNGKQIDSNVTHIIRTRYIPGLVATDRIIYNSRIFNFSAAPINYQESNEITEITAIEVIPEPDDDSS